MAEINFVILKINNIDVSHLTQYEAVQLFLKVSEPILIEVRRKCGDQFNKNLESVDKIKPLKISTTQCISTMLENVTPTAFTLENSAPTTKLHNELVLTLSTPTSLEQQPSNIYTESVRPSLSSATQTDNNFFTFQNHEAASNITDRLINQEHNLFEQVAPDIDIEEITLHKTDINQNIGLNLCYGACNNESGGGYNNGALYSSDDNEIITEVCISEIQPNSVADRDGRLRQGDQILQINGKDLQKKEDVELLLSEHNSTVTLLVSRYLYADDDFNDTSIVDDIDGDEDEDEEEEVEFYNQNNLSYENYFIKNGYLNVAEEMDRNLVAQKDSFRIATTVKNGRELSTIIEKTNNETNTSNKTKNCKHNMDKDDVPGDQQTKLKASKEYNYQHKKLLTEQSTNSTNVKEKGTNACNFNYETEHIYETIPEDSESEPLYCSPYDNSMYMTAVGSCSSNTTVAETTGVLHLQQQKQRVAQWLGLKSNVSSSIVPVTGSKQPICINKCGCNCLLIHDCASTSISTEACINRTGSLQESTVTNNCVTSSSDSCVIVSSNVSYSHAQNDKEHDNLSSGLKNSPAPITLLLLKKQNCSDVEFTLSDNPMQQQVTENIQHQPQQLFSPKTMYTNEANLQQTMLLQQHLLRQALIQQQNIQQQTHFQQLQQQCPQFTAPNLSKYHFVSSQQVEGTEFNEVSPVIVRETPSSITHRRKPNCEETTMVWKVKRRQDGTRYIVRRPARNNIIGTQAMRLNSERMRNNYATTTEDDTISEIKTGRYWTKEERKKHIERVRERRLLQQQQYMIHATMRISDKPTTALATKPQHSSILQHKQKPLLLHKHQIRPLRQCLSKEPSLQQSTPYQSEVNPLLIQQKLYQYSLPSTLINVKDSRIPDNSDSSTITQSCLPSKSVSSNLYHCSSVDQTLPILSVQNNVSAVRSTLASDTAALQVTTSSICSADNVYDVDCASTPEVTTHPKQGFQTETDINKITSLLSVTTV